ncbi:hypothetical protein PCASD_18502, partial [Puccinia coronata f. sp. avenae]
YQTVPFTAGINRSNTAAQEVLEQPCSTGGRTDTVRPKQEPTGRTDLSDRSRLVLCNRSQELIGQACPTRRQVLWSDMLVRVPNGTLIRAPRGSRKPLNLRGLREPGRTGMPAVHACLEGVQGLHALRTGVHGQHACPAGPHAEPAVLAPFVGVQTARLGGRAHALQACSYQAPA